MDIQIIQGGMIVVAALTALYFSLKGDSVTQPTKRGKNITQEEEDMVDPGELGSATGQPASVTTVGVAKLDIVRNTDGLVESIKGIPLSIINNDTVGAMTAQIRDLCRNGQHQMGRLAAFDLATKIKELRAKKQAVEPDAASKKRSEVNAA